MKLSGSAALPSMLQIPGYMAVIKKITAEIYMIKPKRIGKVPPIRVRIKA